MKPAAHKQSDSASEPAGLSAFEGQAEHVESEVCPVAAEYLPDDECAFSCLDQHCCAFLDRIGAFLRWTTVLAFGQKVA